MRVHSHHPKSLWLKILPITPYYSRILMLSVPQLHCFHRPGGRGVPPHCRIHEPVHDHRKDVGTRRAGTTVPRTLM